MAARQEFQPAPPTPVGADVWFSVIIGLVLIAWGRQFISFLIAKVSGREFHTGMIFSDSGKEVPYPELQGFVMYTESGLVLFGIALLLDAAARGTGKRALVKLAFAASILTTLYNGFVASKFFANNAGLPIVSLLAIAFGGFMAITQWQWLKAPVTKTGA
jgi:hypothetical protein